MFYILNPNGEPLMPTSRYRHIKELINQGKAVKVSSKPFVAKLLHSTQMKRTSPRATRKSPGLWTSGNISAGISTVHMGAGSTASAAQLRRTR